MTQRDWKEQFNILTGWIGTKGYNVILCYDAEDCIYFEEKEIHINSSCKPENQFYTLLHECGHYIIDENNREFLREHPLYPLEVSDKRIHKGKAYKVCLVSMETLAWREGLRLARELKLYVHTPTYFKAMTDSVYSYMVSTQT